MGGGRGERKGCAGKEEGDKALQIRCAEVDQEGRAPVQYFFVDGEWQASDANVADQPFLLQLHQLRNGLLYYLKITICQLTQRHVYGLSAITAIMLS